MKIKLILIVILVLLPNSKLLVQDIPDCWCKPKYYPPNGEFFNEHFYYDTCGAKYASSNCDSAYWLNINRSLDGKNRRYAKYYWILWFDVKAFPLPYYPPDTLIEVTWRDVDSINYPEIRDSLRMIEIEYDKYKMIKNAPELTEPSNGQTFIVSFDNYVNGVELENKFNTIPYANCDFKAGAWEINAIDDIIKFHNSKIIITPNPAIDNIIVRFEDSYVKKIEIISIYGEILKEINIQNFDDYVLIDISDIPAGFYIIRIGNNIGKFIKV